MLGSSQARLKLQLSLKQPSQLSIQQNKLAKCEIGHSKLFWSEIVAFGGAMTAHMLCGAERHQTDPLRNEATKCARMKLTWHLEQLAATQAPLYFEVPGS